RSDVPYLNETVFSTNREELISRSGSRYAPASPCDRLDEVASMEGRSVFIGKPCDVAAVQQARRIRPELDEKLGCVIGFFCAGAPSTKGTLALLEEVGIPDPSRLKSLRYRGNGWPGMWKAVYEDDDGREKTIERTYADSWGFVQRYRQWRCYICPDHTGEFADLAVGDPWYRDVQPGESGSSLIIVRTERGREILKAAVAAGYVRLERQDSTLLPRSQPNLLSTRGGLGARLLALRLFGAAVPAYTGFRTFPFWLRHLSLKAKISSFSGTVKRVFRKRLRESVDVVEWSPPSK
ncbi:MAG: coenzyme F420 hydrogenase, partial [Actinomycetales bacterium]|nr:coenzyme F420 hydrogenase [Actinomycetales bacterium]